MKHYYIYILGNWTGDVLYIGVTSNLERRLYEYKYKLVKGFTHKYAVDKLLYHETYEVADDAIKREKQLKKWRRSKKVWLIETINPKWKDLSEGWD